MINKIGFELIKNNSLNIQKRPENKIQSVQNRGEISNIYYKPISFRGADLIDRIYAIEDVHCPICGVSTLSCEKFEEIRSQEYKTAHDLAVLMRANKKYIAPALRGLIDRIEYSSSRNPELPANIAISLLYKYMRPSQDEKFVKFKENVNKNAYKNEFSDEDVVLLNKVFKSIENYKNQKSSYSESRQGCIDLIKEMQNDYKYTLHGKVRDILKEFMLERFCLAAKDYNEITPEERVQIFINKLFMNSVKNKMDFNFTNDKINGISAVVCSGCENSRTSIVDKQSNESKSMKNIATYINDIYNSPDFDEDLKNYTLKIKLLVDKLSGGNVNTSKLSSSKFDNVKNMLFYAESVSTNFELAKLEDVPCASCGTPTLNFEQKEKIRNAIDKVKNMEELRKIINENFHHFKYIHKPVFKDFNKLLDENPEISEDEMVVTLRKLCEDRLNSYIAELYSLVTKYSQDNSDYSQDALLCREYLKRVENKYMSISGMTMMDEYMDIFNNTLRCLRNPVKKSSTYQLKDKIWHNSMALSLLYPPKEFSRNSTMLREIIAFTFAHSSSTVDHVLAKSKGGSDNPENLMILCNDCNKRKADKKFIKWVKKDKEIPVNMQNYLNFVVPKIKENHMEKYYDYAKKFINNVIGLTHHELVLKKPVDTEK